MVVSISGGGAGAFFSCTSKIFYMQSECNIHVQNVLDLVIGYVTVVVALLAMVPVQRTLYTPIFSRSCGTTIYDFPVINGSVQRQHVMKTAVNIVMITHSRFYCLLLSCINTVRVQIKLGLEEM